MGTDWTVEVGKSQERSFSQFFTIEDQFQGSVCNQEALPTMSEQSEQQNVQIIISINPLGVNICTNYPAIHLVIVEKCVQHSVSTH